MCDEKVPRPITYISDLFNQNEGNKAVTGKKLLNTLDYISVGSWSNASIRVQRNKKKTRDRLATRHLRLPVMSTSDYVQTLCDFLQIHFKIAKVVKRRVEEIEWYFYGSKPEAIIGAVLLIVLHASGDLKVNIWPTTIAYEVDCKLKYLQTLAGRILTFKKEWIVNRN
jgi:uncharacterized protein YutD